MLFWALLQSTIAVLPLSASGDRVARTRGANSAVTDCNSRTCSVFVRADLAFDSFLFALRWLCRCGFRSEFKRRLIHKHYVIIRILQRPRRSSSRSIPAGWRRQWRLYCMGRNRFARECSAHFRLRGRLRLHSGWHGLGLQFHQPGICHEVSQQ